MSEYPYYGFRAVDHPLDQQAQEELRQLSSRAEIAATGFVNEYNYGDFRGNIDEVLTHYFDVFVYVANWAMRRLIFRLPADLIDSPKLEVYATGGDLDVSGVLFRKKQESLLV